MIEIMNLHNVKASKPYDVHVCRPHILGNPFLLDRTRNSRNKVCDQYARWLHDEVDKLSPRYHELERIRQIYKKHGRLRLFCWCAPLRCHAETIRDYLTGIVE